MKKYRSFFIITLIISFLILNIIKADSSALPLFGKVIYIDPGHEGY